MCVCVLVDKALVHSWAKNRFVKENIFIVKENGKSIRADLGKCVIYINRNIHIHIHIYTNTLHRGQEV